MQSIDAQPAEIFRLVLTLALLPAYAALLREIRRERGRGWIVAAFFAILASFATSLVDGGPTGLYVEVVTHSLIAAAGILALVFVLHIRAQTRGPKA